MQPISLDFPGQFSLQHITNDGKYAYGLTQREEGINAPRHLIKVSMETQDFESVRNFGFVSDIDLSFDKQGDLIYAQWIDDGPQSISFKNTTASKVIAISLIKDIK